MSLCSPSDSLEASREASPFHTRDEQTRESIGARGCRIILYSHQRRDDRGDLHRFRGDGTSGVQSAKTWIVSVRREHRRRSQRDLAARRCQSTEPSLQSLDRDPPPRLVLAQHGFPIDDGNRLLWHMSRSRFLVRDFISSSLWRLSRATFAFALKRWRSI